MLTPQEVSERSFVKATFGGYNMSQVDEFLDILTDDYSTLYTENTTLKRKMKVLVEKVEEYRSTEEAMRKALMTAQRMADELVAEAEQKKADLLKNAEAEAQQRMDELKAQVRTEELRLEKAQEATVSFVAKVRSLQSEEEQLLAHLDELCPQDDAAVQDQVAATVSEIDDNVQRLLAQAMSDATAENLRSRPDVGEDHDDLSDTAEFTPCRDLPQSDRDDEDRDEEDEDRRTPDSRRDRREPDEADRRERREPDEMVRRARRLDDDDDIYDDEDMSRTRRIDFGDLQFGADYEVK